MHADSQMEFPALVCLFLVMAFHSATEVYTNVFMGLKGNKCIAFVLLKI